MTGTRRARRRTVRATRRSPRPKAETVTSHRCRPNRSDRSPPRRPPAPSPRLCRRAFAEAHRAGSPGFKRRFFNDDGNRLADAEELGYDHVSETGLKTSSPGSRVSRLVGTKANGEPLHAFLMETPDELYAQGEAEKEAACRTVDDAIRAGRDSTGQMSPTETYGQGSINSDR
jgi:hypothetical protein